MDIVKNQKGAVSLVIVILALGVLIGISSIIFLATISEQKLLNHSLRSEQAYYAAESGLEDILLRLRNSLNWSSDYNLVVGQASTSVSVSDIVGGARTISSKGGKLNNIRNVAVSYEITTDDVSFNYGAQTGEGGLIIENGCTVDGNLYSNGDVIASGNHIITGTVKVAKAGNKIDGAKIGGDAYADICINSEITGNLSSNSFSGCSAAATSSLPEEIATSALPITEDMVNKWKAEAEASGVTVGDVNLAGSDHVNMGPHKIDGNLSMSVSSILSMTGTIWVTGDLTISQSSILELDNAYGNLSGAIIVDGLTDLSQTGKARGSGTEGSYLVIVSTNSGNPAIAINNSFEADILFALNGWVTVKNSTNIREITGYGIHIKNHAGLVYEVGLADTSFTTGPGGSWTVTNWREIE